MNERGAPLFPVAPKRHRVYRGLSERQELIFHWIAVAVILVFLAGWIGALTELARDRNEAIAEAKAAGVPVEDIFTPSQQIASAMTEPSRGPAFITDAMLGFLGPLRGESGKVQFTTQTPGAPIVKNAPEEAGAVLSGHVSPDFAAPAEPGVYQLAVQFNEATRSIENFNVITLVPRSQKRGGKIGFYYLGNWPWETGGKPRAPSYEPPSGFIQVTRENQNTHVSPHFRLRDFLTKDQPNVWPKYLLLNPKLIDKLELTIDELESRGIKVTHMQVMSGFRTPRYNHSGGNTAGRANLSRHMYGDACDVFVDNDRNGNMDDINKDGRVNARDAEIIGQALDRVERKYPSLVGGVGVYSACCGHGPFTHVDVRGFRARWRGSGNG